MLRPIYVHRVSKKLRQCRGRLFGDPKTPVKVTPNKLKHDSAFRVGVRVRLGLAVGVRVRVGVRVELGDTIMT